MCRDIKLPFLVVHNVKLASNNLLSYSLYETFFCELMSFLRATAGTAIAHLSHRNSVRLSVCHMGDSVKNDASQDA